MADFQVPDPDVSAGDIGHPAHHDALTNSVQRAQNWSTALESNPWGLVGGVGTVAQLPNPGTPGQNYLVGPVGDVFGWQGAVVGWVIVGNIRGPQGQPGQSGSIIGTVNAGAVPPPGSPLGSLWFEPDSGVITPPVLSPTFFAASSMVNAGIPSISMPVPPGITNGDIGIMVIASGLASPLDTPPGWTLLDAQAPSGSTSFKLFSKVLASGESNFNITQGGSGKSAASLVVCRNVKLVPATNEPHKRAYLAAATSATTQPSATATPTVNSLNIGFWLERQGVTGSGAFTLTGPAAFVSATQGLSAQTGGGCASTSAGYDNTPRSTLPRPNGTQNWVRSVAGLTPNTATWSICLEAA